MIEKIKGFLVAVGIFLAIFELRIRVDAVLVLILALFWHVGQFWWGVKLWICFLVSVALIKALSRSLYDNKFPRQDPEDCWENVVEKEKKLYSQP